MKKIILAAAVIATTCLSAQPAFSTTTKNISYNNTDKDERSKELTIVPDRKSGETVVRFKASKAAEASITVLDESGKVVLQQTNQLTPGINNMPIANSMKLEEGFYTIRLATKNQTFNSRFLIWK